MIVLAFHSGDQVVLLRAAEDIAAKLAMDILAETRVHPDIALSRSPATTRPKRRQRAKRYHRIEPMLNANARPLPQPPANDGVENSPDFVERRLAEFLLDGEDRSAIQQLLRTRRSFYDSRKQRPAVLPAAVKLVDVEKELRSTGRPQSDDRVRMPLAKPQAPKTPLNAAVAKRQPTKIAAKAVAAANRPCSSANKTFAVDRFSAKERVCLYCQKPFLSEHAGNRRCDKCSDRAEVRGAPGLDF
jgi:hypothetical protein